MDGYDGYDGYASTLFLEPGDDLFDEFEAPEVVLPADPAGAWPLGVFASDFLTVPDCPCCLEPEAVSPVLLTEPTGAVRWAVPGVWDAPVVSSPPSPGPLVQAVLLAVAALQKVDPAEASAEQAVADLDGLLRVQQDLRRVVISALGDARVRRTYGRDNEPSLGSWLRRRHPERPTADITLSQHLRTYPILRQRVLAGRLTCDAGRQVANALGHARANVDRPDGLIDGQLAGPVLDAIIGNTLDLIRTGTLSSTLTATTVDGNGVEVEVEDPRILALRAELDAIRNGRGPRSDSDSGTGTGGGSGVASELGQVEAALVLLAEHLPARFLPNALAEQLGALLPSRLEDQARRAEDARRLALHPHPDRPGGRITIEANAELWETLHVLLAAMATRDPVSPLDTAALHTLRHQGVTPDDLTELYQHHEHIDWNPLSQPNGPNEPGVHRPRSKGKRLHDALLLLLQTALAQGLAGSRDNAPVSINVTLSERLLHHLPGARPATGGSAKILPTSLIRRWWCDAAITPIVLSHTLKPLGTIHTQRTLTSRERKASRTQHGGPASACAGMSCCRPGDPLVQLEPHHLTRYAVTGTTSTSDTIWACQALHHQLHHNQTIELRNGNWANEHGYVPMPEAARQ